MTMRAIVVAALCGFLTVLSDPVRAADAQNGAQLAQRWCATCHVVGPGQRQGSAAVPPFTEIAKRPDFDAATLALFLLNPHPLMPNMSLTRNEAADIAAYIATLKQ